MVERREAASANGYSRSPAASRAWSRSRYSLIRKTRPPRNSTTSNSRWLTSMPLSRPRPWTLIAATTIPPVSMISSTSSQASSQASSQRSTQQMSASCPRIVVASSTGRYAQSESKCVAAYEAISPPLASPLNAAYSARTIAALSRDGTLSGATRRERTADIAWSTDRSLAKVHRVRTHGGWPHQLRGDLHVLLRHRLVLEPGSFESAVVACEVLQPLDQAVLEFCHLVKLHLGRNAAPLALPDQASAHDYALTRISEFEIGEPAVPEGLSHHLPERQDSIMASKNAYVEVHLGGNPPFDVRIEIGQGGLILPFVIGLDAGLDPLHVLLRHRPRSISRGDTRYQSGLG